MMQRRPLVGVIACRRQVEGHPAHIVTDKYLRALYDFGLAPVVLPVWEDEVEISLLERLDGLMLTGSYTNVEPCRYGAERIPENTRDDRDRDAVAFELIPAAVELGLPLLGICRGFQEINVAMGGTLYQAVQKVPGMLDHREPEGDSANYYMPAHDLTIEPGGVLAGLFDQPTARVNSLHQQGVEHLGKGLRVEGRAPDGLVEAFSIENAKAFTLAVQWHPEWRPHENPINEALFRGFAEACGRATLA